jgi:hypothetical protein
MTDETRCTATEQDSPCRREVIHTTPVALCQAHRIEVALAVVPDLLRGSLITATTEASSPPRLDLVEHAVAVDHEKLLTLDIHDPVVYFVANGGRVKIGYSTNIASRLTALTLRHDNVLLTLAGGPELERALHARFASLRQGNSEWFDMAPELVRYIARRPNPSPAEFLAKRAGTIAGKPPAAQPAQTTPSPAAERRARRTAIGGRKRESPVPAHHIEAARAILAENPSASGEQIAREIGTTGSFGRRVKRAALGLD